MTGSLSGPLARIKVGEKNCLGMIEWKAVRETASRFLPKYTAAATWTHRNLSHVEQEGLSPMPKDRGAEQGDVDGPLECSLAAGLVAAETRGSTAARQAAGTLPWVGVNDPAEEQRLQADHAAKRQESANFQLSGPEKHTGAHDPQHALQKNGGFADQWYMDDESLCLPFLQDFDVANARVGAERNSLKTEVLYYVNDLDAAAPEHHTLSCCRVSTVHHGPAPEQGRCHPCTSAASSARICRQSSPSFGKSLGVSRINHIRRVHGHTILEEQRAALVYDEIG